MHGTSPRRTPAAHRERHTSARLALTGVLLLGPAAPFSTVPDGTGDRATTAPSTTLVSVGLSGRGGSGQSYAPAISADGRYVAFDSDADDLTTGKHNGKNNIFVRDLRTGRTTLVSTDSSGRIADGSSYTPSISGDGRYVAFASEADNLVEGPAKVDGQGQAPATKATHVFLKDRRTGATTRLSLAADGRETTGGTSPAISRDGHWVVYNVGTPLRSIGTDEDLAGMFVYDTTTGKRERLGHVEGDDPTISADGRYVAFSSEVRDLVPNDTNRKYDSFVFDRRTRAVARVSLGGTRAIGHGWYAGDQEANSESTGAVISADGRYVAFASSATNLVPGDTNNADDVFLRDLRTGATRRISVTAGGRQADGSSGGPACSTDGRIVIFLSQAGNLVPAKHGDNGYNLFRADLRDGSITQVNLAPNGAQPDGTTSSYPQISADGHAIAFGSRATNLGTADTNNHDQVFVRTFPVASQH